MAEINKDIAVNIDASGATSGGKTATEELQKIDKATKGLSEGFDLASSAAKGMIAYFSVSTMLGFAKSVVDTGIAVDSLNRSFQAISGTRGGAAEMISFLRKESDRLGQSFYDLAPAFKGVAAASRGTALEGEQTRQIFSAITEASTALGLSSEDTKGALNAISQMMSKGNVQAEELRGQLGERLPGALNLMAQALGVSTSKLNDMLDKGEILASDALPKLAEAIHQMYGKAAETSALESGQAAISRYNQAWKDLESSIYSSKLMGVVNLTSDAINGMTAAINNMPKAHFIWDGIGMNSNGVEGMSTFRDTVKKTTLYADDMWKIFAAGAAKAESSVSGVVSKIESANKKVHELTASPQQKILDKYNELRGQVTGTEQINALDKWKSEELRKLAERDAAPGLRQSKADDREYEKMLADGKKTSELLDKYWDDYENRRVSAVADSFDAKREYTAEELRLQNDFSDKYIALTLGESEAKIQQLERLADAYKKSGSSEVAVAQWVAEEKLRLAEDWQSGAIRGLRDYAKSGTNAAKAVEDAVTNGFKTMEDAIVEFAMTGKMSFTDFANSVIKDMMRMVVQQNITGPLAGAASAGLKLLFGGTSNVDTSSGKDFWIPSAKGNVFDSPSLSAFSGGIYDTPHFFKFASGAGVFGEAGPEAIMPLARGADGNLGVRSSGGGGSGDVIINIVESQGKGGQSQQSKGSDGTSIIDIFFDQLDMRFAQNIANGRGATTKAMQTVFNVNRSKGAYR